MNFKQYILEQSKVYDPNDNTWAIIAKDCKPFSKFIYYDKKVLLKKSWDKTKDYL